ncbi:MAG: hypothetical protein Sapg2KO_14350 [Saprospiraceae bacterium]
MIPFYQNIRAYIWSGFGVLVLSGMIVYSISSCSSAEHQVSFANDIRPILKNKCMSCHGGVAQQGGLSFLFEEHLYKQLKTGKKAVVPGNAYKSEIYQRVINKDPQKVMPPEGEKLTEEEASLLKAWIDQGAKWETHWAYIPPEKPEVPQLAGDWAKNDMDQFVFSKAAEKGLSPNKQAPASALARRIGLDLVGFGPDPESVTYYLNDPNSKHYEQLVDSLLASPHFGEKWASFWLDLARYSDSQGFQKDHIRRTMWLYRDWVIHAFNQDMPVDRFTIAQLAGDLLENPSEQDILATAFHRNTMTNDEGGTDNEEYRVRAVMDRVNTTMEAWQGSTISCVQCHSHPYDPIMHEEYYHLKGYFNNTADRDLTSDFPKKVLLSTAQREKIKKSKAKLASEDNKLSLEEKEALKEYIASMDNLAVPILSELPDSSSRKNPFFVRGNWLMQEGDLSPGVPKSYNRSTADFAQNRLGLAQWLVDKNNPLTARVLVNRIWHQLFGTGLVKTLEDFGIQGEYPSHPQLLDYLADRLMNHHDWQLKPLIKEIVLSATYQQSVSIRPDHLELDPSNRLLMRAPRTRLSAEQIRDQALNVAGLLHLEVYGPSVMPPQPEGVWNVIRNVASWETSPGPQKYRRALYTFHRRVSPYPTMLTFDAPSREVCVSRRIPTNTPLQALTMLNDPVYVEAASALAERTIEAQLDLDESVQWMYRQVFLDNPSKEEQQVLINLYDQDLVSDAASAAEQKNIDLEALTAVASALLNTDKFITKN